MAKKDLLTVSQTIRDETAVGGNTAGEVGGTLVGLVRSSVADYDATYPYITGERMRIGDVEWIAQSNTTASQSPTTHPAKWRTATVTSKASIAEGDYRPVATHVLAQLLAEAEDAEQGDIPLASTTEPGIVQRATLDEIKEGNNRDKYTSPGDIKDFFVDFFSRFSGLPFRLTDPITASQILGVRYDTVTDQWYMTNVEASDSEGGGIGTPVVDSAGNLPILSFKAADGKVYLTPDAKLQERFVTLSRLYNLLKTATVGTSQNTTHFVGIGPDGMTQFPLASLPQGNSSGTPYIVSEWKDLPLGNYVTYPNNPRWFHLGTSPASTVGTTDMLTVEFKYGPWANVNGQLTQTSITVELKNRDGFAAEIKDRWGRSRDAEIRSFLQTSGEVKHYVYFIADYYVVGFIRGHGIGGSAFNPELTPTIGTNSSGVINNRIPPAGRELWSTGTAAPTHDFNGEQHSTPYPTLTEGMATMAETKITNLAVVPPSLTNQQLKEFFPVFHRAGDKKLYKMVGETLSRWLGDNYGIMGLAESGDFVLGPQIVTPPGTNIIPLGVPFSRTITAGLFLSPTGLALTLSVSGPVPAGMTLSGLALSDTPTASGTYSLTVKATDTNGKYVEAPWIITVLPGNRAPFIPEIPDQTASLTTQTVISLYPLYAAIDPDGDAVTYGYASETNLITFDNSPTGLQYTVPAGLTPGKSYWVQLKATDTAGNVTSRQFNIIIPPAGVADFAMASPAMDCANMRITINTTGGAAADTREYRIMGVRDWSPNKVFDLPAGIVNDPNTTKLTLQARIGTNIVQVVDYLFRASCTPAGSLPAPTAPTYTPRTVVVGRSVSIPILDFTPPSGTTLTYAYDGLPGWLTIGPELVGGGMTSSPTIHGIAPSAGNIEITVTAKASNGTEASAKINILILPVTTGGYKVSESTNPNLLRLKVTTENGALLLSNEATPGQTLYYKLNGDKEAPLTRTDLNGVYPLGQNTYVEVFTSNTPGDTVPSAAQHVTFYTT